MNNKEPIYVTQPFLPPLEEFVPYLQEIWRNKILTNGGPFHQQLESALCEFLGVNHVALFNNGTIALITALQTLGLTGEVITTPYSFVATAHSLLWRGLTPVFVDIDPITLNLDPERIEAAITPRTTAILPVHCYGQPCDVEAIERVAVKHDLKVVYDAAHAFGVRVNGRSVLTYGDLSILSFHATKVFNTFEGGAIICPDAATKRRIDQLKNFGFIDEFSIEEAGINGKMSEVNAAFGILQLSRIDEALKARQRVDAAYREALGHVPGIRCMAGPGEWDSNYSYFPILVDAAYPLTRDQLFERLREHGVIARRYFYPLISAFPKYMDLPSAAPGQVPIAAAAAERIICLPIHPGLSAADLDRIVTLVAANT
jgi:dTDP-4-amino-4,6-dideoxygalactose transaminase